MTAAVIGALRVTLGIDTAAFEEGLGIAQKRLSAAGKKLTSIGDNLKGLGGTLSVALTAPLAAFAASSVSAANESAAAIAQVNAALASMGPVAGKTSEQLEAAAAHLQSISTFDDDDILKSVTANMLTFGKVTGEAFDRAQLAAVNLSARLGQDLQSSAIMVGKALNDPIKGVTALSRVGVSFTADQKAMIKEMAAAGNVAGAQAIILGELEKQYGGAAQAARDATPGADTIDAWREFQETVGAIVVEVLPVLTDMLKRVLDAFNGLSPETQKYIVYAAALAAALGPVLIVVGSVVSALGALLPLLAPITAAFGVLAGIITGTVIPAIGSVIVALSPILIPLAAVAAAIAAVYLVWKNWDKIEPILRDLYNGVKSWIMDKLNAVWDWLQGKLKAVGQWFYDLYDAVVGHSYIPDMVDEIGANMARLDKLMVDPAKKAATSTKEAFRGLAGDVASILDQLFPLQAELKSVMDDMATLKEARAKGLIDQNTYDQAAGKLDNQAYSLERQIRGSGPPIIDAGTLTNVPAIMVDTEQALKDLIATLPQLPPVLSDAAKAVGDFGRDLGNTLMGALNGFLTGRGNLGDLLRDGLKNVLNRSVTDALANLETAIFGEGGLGGKLGSIFSNIFSSIFKGFPGFALGGSFTVGGSPGRDANLVAFRATRGEKVTISDGDAAASSGGFGSLQFNFYGPVTNPQEVKRSAAQAGAHLLRMTSAGQRGT